MFHAVPSPRCSNGAQGGSYEIVTHALSIYPRRSASKPTDPSVVFGFSFLDAFPNLLHSSIKQIRFLQYAGVALYSYNRNRSPPTGNKQASNNPQNNDAEETSSKGYLTCTETIIDNLPPRKESLALKQYFPRFRNDHQIS